MLLEIINDTAAYASCGPCHEESQGHIGDDVERQTGDEEILLHIWSNRNVIALSRCVCTSISTPSNKI